MLLIKLLVVGDISLKFKNGFELFENVKTFYKKNLLSWNLGISQISIFFISNFPNSYWQIQSSN